jgi:glycosyltransferase involved in cell wall biosynthesis
MKISVIIPCRNERTHIRGFLDSLQKQRLETDWSLEILVADGMSDDGTREVLRSYAARMPNVRVIDNPQRIVSTGLNAAILAASGEIILRMDAHTTYAPDYIRECARVLRETGADNVGGPWRAEGRGLVGRAISAAFHAPFCTGGGKAHDPEYEGEVDTVYLGCWPRAVFSEVGLFDPNLVRNQDDEFNLRIRRAGGRVWQSPRIRSRYSPRASMKALFRQYLQYGFWKVWVIRKHRALAAYRHAVPALFVSSVLLGVLLIALAASFGLAALMTTAAILLGLELLLYACACIAASIPFARSVDPPVLIILPGVMVVYHVAYGLGFLTGLWALLAGRACSSPPRLFTALTR